MMWHPRYLIRRYVGNSIWIPPALGIAAALGAAKVVALIDAGRGLQSALNPDAARNVLATLAASMFTCIIFASSTLLLVVQLASAQLTPRIIAIVFRDPITKLSLTVFGFVFTFSLAVLVRVGDTVPVLGTQLAAYSCVVSLGVFLVLIDHVVKFLRPSGALRSVATRGHRVIESVFPRPLAAAPAPPLAPGASLDGTPTHTVTTRSNGVILAVDVQGVALLAEQWDCVIVMLPQVGDFVAAGDPLFRVFGGAPALPERALRRSIAVGDERTFEQDPALAFRMIVDVAAKALSPAINDPTTAVLAIDQIHYMLRNVGKRWLDEGHVRDAAGRVRFVYRTPDWEDFVRLAVTEIRQFGRESVQVTRRLRSMLADLIRTLPRERTALLRQELRRLHRTVKRSFPEPDDRALADVSDSQGVGGKAEDHLHRMDVPNCVPRPQRHDH